MTSLRNGGWFPNAMFTFRLQNWVISILQRVMSACQSFCFPFRVTRNTMTLAFLAVLYTYLGLAAALSKEGWRSQSIYQLLTDRYARTNGSEAPCSNLGGYCGGSWQGIINNLDYIQDMGFTAIWISPITENIQDYTRYGAAYHGFWPQKINEVNSNFGTAADLKALSNALHERGMVCRSLLC